MSENAESHPPRLPRASGEPRTPERSDAVACGLIVSWLHIYICLVPVTLFWPEQVLMGMTGGLIRLPDHSSWSAPIRLGMAALFLIAFTLVMGWLLKRKDRTRMFYWGVMGATMNMGFWILAGFLFYLPFAVIIWWTFGRRYREFFPLKQGNGVGTST